MKTAIFDLDGTIADTIYDLADAVNFGLRRMNLPEHSIEQYKNFVGNGVQLLCYRALPDDKKSESEKLRSLFSQYYDRHYLDKTKLYPGIKDTMMKLSENGVKLAVATNKPQNVARQIISKLLPNIDFVKVLGGCDEREKKPDPAIIREILSVLPNDNKAFMIGDSNVDIRTAKNSGIASIGCIWGFRSRQELVSENSDFIAEKAEDISKFILG